MKCKICKDREAEVRDRGDPTNSEKAICRDCQRQVLLSNMAMILDYYKRRYKC